MRLAKASCVLFDFMCAECHAFYLSFTQTTSGDELARVAATGRCPVWLIAL